MPIVEIASNCPEDLRAVIELKGLCEVNGVILSHASRYMIAKMEFALSKTDLKRAKKHLKDCPSCTEIVEKLGSEKEPY
jgi:hypothetical protein